MKNKFFQYIYIFHFFYYDDGDQYKNCQHREDFNSMFKNNMIN